MTHYVIYHTPSQQYVKTGLTPPARPGQTTWSVQFDLTDADGATWFASQEQAGLIRDWLCGMTDYAREHLEVKEA